MTLRELIAEIKNIETAPERRREFEEKLEARLKQLEDLPAEWVVVAKDTELAPDEAFLVCGEQLSQILTPTAEQPVHEVMTDILASWTSAIRAGHMGVAKP